MATLSDPSVMPSEGYTPVARALHWLTAVLVILVILGGIAMTNMGDGPVKDTIYNLHRSTGVLLIPLIIFRLIYRLLNPPPPLSADIPQAQRIAAHAIHWALYALLLIQPLIGWVATSAYGAQIVVYGLFVLPPVVAQDQAFAEQLFGIHKVLGIAIAVLIIGHAGAALFHHFILRDNTLERMLRS